jgi:ABC-type uncharacterized transport system ATPase subunit
MNSPGVRNALDPSIHRDRSAEIMTNKQGVVYLGTEWASNPVVRSDIVVSHFLDSVGGYRHKARRDKLLALLDVDLDWYVLQRPRAA